MAYPYQSFPTIGGSGPLSGLPMPQIGAPPSVGGGGFQIPSWLGPLIGTGIDIYHGLTQDQQSAANFAAQQQRQQQLAGLLGGMYQGGASPYEAQLAKMLGITPQGGAQNPWAALFGGQAPSTPGANPTPTANNPNLPWWQRTGQSGANPSSASLSPSMSMGMSPFTGQIPDIGGMTVPGLSGIPAPAGGFGGWEGAPPVQPRGLPGAMTMGGVNPNGLGYTPGMYGAERINIADLMNSPGSASAQDGLMQMLRRDPANQMVNAQGLIGANTDLFNRQTDRSAEMLRGRARGLGQLAGSASANAEALLRGDAGAQLGQQNANLLYQTATGNADRSLNLYGQQLGGWGTLGQLGNQSQGNMLQAMLANQQAGNQASQFNLTNQNQANQFGINTYLNSLMNAQNMGQQRQQGNLDLASLFAGLPVPQRQGGGQALGAASDAAWLPYILGMIGR